MRCASMFGARRPTPGPRPKPREPPALHCWILEILYCTPKGCRALLLIPSTEGRSVCLCWAKSKPKGPKRPRAALSVQGYLAQRNSPPPQDPTVALICRMFLMDRFPKGTGGRSVGATGYHSYGGGENPQNMCGVLFVPMDRFYLFETLARSLRRIAPSGAQKDGENSPCA